MTKYSQESMKEDYEPEEGEIQDDDDQMVEAPSKSAGSTTSNKGTNRETCSKSFLLCHRDESKSCSQKSYGGKPYYTPGSPDDAFISSHSSRTRYQTSPTHKRYHTHRRSRSTSNEWGGSKSSIGPKEKERHESKRTSRNQNYSVKHLSCDQRSVHITTGNSCLNSSIPPWHWYSRHARDRNKRMSVSPSKITVTMRHISSRKPSRTNNSRFSLDSVFNTEKNSERNKPNLEKNSHPSSPASANSIEIIEVPPKIPEVITIDDSDEESSTHPNAISISSKNTMSLSMKNNISAENEHKSSEILQKSRPLKDILLRSRNNSIQEHTVLRNCGLEMQELNAQQINNTQEINLPIEGSTSSFIHMEIEGNNLVNQINKDSVTLTTNTNVNTNESMFDKSIAQVELFNNEEHNNEYWGRNADKDVCFGTQMEISASQLTSNMSEAPHQVIEYSTHGSCSTSVILSSPEHSIGYMIDDKFSSVFTSVIDPQAQIYPASLEVLDNNITSEALLTRGESAAQRTIQQSAYSPTVFQAVPPHCEIHSSQNQKCSCQNNINISSYKSNVCVPSTLRINRNINYSVLKLIVPTNEKANTFYQHTTPDNEITGNCANDKDKGNSLCIDDKEKNSNILHIHTSHEVDQGEENPEVSQKGISVSMNNIDETECSSMPEDKMVLPKQNATLRDDCNGYTEPETTRSENINFLSQEHTAASEHVENNVPVNDAENETSLWKNSSSTESLETVQVSTVAALKRRATELKKLQHHKPETGDFPLRKTDNQKLQYQSHKLTAFSLPSHFPSSRSLNEDDNVNADTIARQVNVCGNTSDYTINSLDEKYLAYTSPPLVYEDRIGARMDRENGHFSDQMANRINVTVPELIINLGKESDSGDDSDDKSTRSKTVDDSTHETKAEHNTKSEPKSVSSDFEKKLEVLLKEARSQQESNAKLNKRSIITRERLATSRAHPDTQEDSFAPLYSTFPYTNVQPLNAAEGCARATPRSSVKKTCYSRTGKSKTPNHRIKSVVVGNVSGTVNQDRTMKNNNERTIKHPPSATFNSYRQANKGGNRNEGNKGIISRQTSSMGDIGLLSPGKQKEYVKLKRQLVQMTERKKDSRYRERRESVALSHRISMQEKSKLKQTIENTTNIRNNSQEIQVTFETEGNLLSKAVLETDQKSLNATPGNKPSEIQINIGNHYQQIYSSESYSCSNEQYVNIINTEQNTISSQNPTPRSNVSQINIESESTAISDSQGPSQEDIVFHQREHPSTSIEKQTCCIISSNNDSETIIHDGGSMSSGKRKIAIDTQEQVQKKQKTANNGNESSTSGMHDAIISETVNKHSSQSKLVEDLWSSETKLIARRRQTLEDIATVRLQLYKIEAANFRKDLLVKDIDRLKDELKQSEEKLKQEEEYVQKLSSILDDSKLIVQRGQSELISLSLECEELGCKVYGPPNYNVPKACVDLIRSEMSAMAEAMQELENRKNFSFA